MDTQIAQKAPNLVMSLRNGISYESRSCLLRRGKPYSLTCSNVSRRRIVQFFRIIESYGAVVHWRVFFFRVFNSVTKINTTLVVDYTSSGDPNLAGAPIAQSFTYGMLWKEAIQLTAKVHLFSFEFPRRRCVRVCRSWGTERMEK